MKIPVTRAFLIFLALMAGFHGQRAYGQDVARDYDRNGLSVMVVEREVSYDYDVSGMILGMDWGGKFDMNPIPTTSVAVSGSRWLPIAAEDVTEAVSKTDAGKEVLAYIFGRTADGMMNDSIVKFRGAYNATDQEVINARASAVGVAALGDRGYALVNSSYLMVMDVVYVKNSDHGTLTSRVDAYVYKVALSKEKLDDFLEKCWIFEDDSEEVRAQKMKNFDEYQVDLEFVTSTPSYGSGDSVEESVTRACFTGLTYLEDEIPQWNVATTIYSTKPLRAKIGTKEGLHNGARYRAYTYREDAEGNLIAVKRGYLRATEVCENRTVSTGESAMSRFYQISGGANIQEGWTIEQSNDTRFGLIVGAKYGGVAHEGYSVTADLDYIPIVTKNGSNFYVMLSLAVDVTNGTANYSSAIGAGFGLHATRFVEITPYLMLGDDCLAGSKSSSSSSSSSSRRTYSKKVAYLLEPGVRVAVNIAYPMQLVIKGSYDWLFSKGEWYKESAKNARHDSGGGISAGLKWTF